MILDRMLRRLSQSRPFLLGLAMLVSVSDAGAQSPPPNVVRFVAGGAGTPPDVLSRIIGNELSESEGWQVIVENRPGALETIAMGAVLKQAADGRHVFAMSLPTIAAPSLFPSLGMRP